MGQDITATKIDSGTKSSHIYSLDRSLTGMENTVYDDPEMVVDPKSGADVLAKRLLDIGVESVAIYSNVVTVNCEPEVYSRIEKQVDNIIANLFRFYGDDAGWDIASD